MKKILGIILIIIFVVVIGIRWIIYFYSPSSIPFHNVTEIIIYDYYDFTMDIVPYEPIEYHVTKEETVELINYFDELRFSLGRKTIREVAILTRYDIEIKLSNGNTIRFYPGYEYLQYKNDKFTHSIYLDYDEIRYEEIIKDIINKLS
ncbi:hypothetical protein RJG79_08125 [Mycoplasmatota bacterium WC44]